MADLSAAERTNGCFDLLQLFEEASDVGLEEVVAGGTARGVIPSSR